jgi:predicted Fe-Mo cluster-binding NifX family protein
MKVAFAHWNDRIAPVFDTARQVHIVETGSGQVLRESPELLPGDPIVQKALRLAALGVDALVCGAISRPLQETIAAYGIQVIPFVAGDLHQVIQAFLQGRPMDEAFAMPGCRGRGWQRRRKTHPIYQEDNTMNGRGQGMGSGGRKGQGGQRPGRRGGRMGAGTAGYCTCPQCGHQEAHQRGVPCVEQKCPQCGTAMTRQ